MSEKIAKLDDESLSEFVNSQLNSIDFTQIQGVKSVETAATMGHSVEGIKHVLLRVTVNYENHQKLGYLHLMEGNPPVLTIHHILIQNHDKQ